MCVFFFCVCGCGPSSDVVVVGFSGRLGFYFLYLRLANPGRCVLLRESFPIVFVFEKGVFQVFFPTPCRQVGCF